MNILKDSSLNGNIIGKTQEKLFADELDRTGVIDHHLLMRLLRRLLYLEHNEMQRLEGWLIGIKQALNDFAREL